MTNNVTIIHRPLPEGMTDDQVADLLAPLAADLTLSYLRSLGATIDRCHIGGRGYVTTARMGSASTVLRQKADGTYTADHPEVVYAFEAANRSEDEAERLFEPEIDLDVLPF